MGISAGAGTGTEAAYATFAALAALDAEDAALASAGSGAAAGDGVDVLQRAYEIRLERLELEKKLEAQAAARKARSAAQAMDLQHAMTPPDAPLHDRTYTEMSTVEEIAGILTISSGAAGAFVEQSRRLCALPPVMDALATGSLSWQQARIFVDETKALDHDAATTLVEHFLDPEAPNPARGCPASELVPARLRAKLRGWRERHHPESIEKRHARSVADRRVELTPDRDGMAWIAAYMPAHLAMAAWNDLTATARGLQGPTETRTLTQLRPDILASRLLTNRTATALAAPATALAPATGVVPATGDMPGDAPEDMIDLATLEGSDQPAAALGISDDAINCGNAAPAEPDLTAAGSSESTPNTARAGTAADPAAGKVPTPRADVLVTVPWLALCGVTDEPAMLDGYGPIPASIARKLLIDGAESFRRVLLDPSDGTPLEIGRTSYRVTNALRKVLQIRDGKCVFPGCNNNALDNEADHLIAWEHGGTTGITNLGQLCPKHHRLKHNSGWTPTEATKDQPPGYTSPTGRHYQAEQPDHEPPQLPQHLLQEALDAACRKQEPPGSPNPASTDTGTDADAKLQAPTGLATDEWPPSEWFEAWLDSAPPCHVPPPEIFGTTEPEDPNLINPNDVPLDDPAWDEFWDSYYATPFALQPDPERDWALALP